MTTRQMSMNSLLAFHGSVKDNLTKREEQVLEALEDIGRPAYAAEIAERLERPEHTISGRFTGLKAKGRIKLVAHGLNRFGRRVGYYAVVPAEEREYGDER